jgi:hypothetical protein
VRPSLPSAEGIEKRRTWLRPCEKRRCLVPADGYYEWKHLDKKTKQPFAFRMRVAAPFVFAGLWDAWQEPDGGWLQSYSLHKRSSRARVSDESPPWPIAPRTRNGLPFPSYPVPTDARAYCLRSDFCFNWGVKTSWSFEKSG